MKGQGSVSRFKASPHTMRNLLIRMIIGGAISLAGVIVAPDRTWPNLLLANTTQIINSTLNNNEMVQIATKAVNKALDSNNSVRGAIDLETNVAIH